MEITVVSPVYKSESLVVSLVERIEKTIEKLTNDYEIILVDDASTDNSWNEIEKIALRNKRVKGIQLSRNFGQHYAISAGLDYAKGNWIVVMDCDLQDVPEEITKLYLKTKEGFDIVLARRINRKDSLFQKTFSLLFYKVLGYLTGTDQDQTIANFGIYSNKVVQSICSMKENVRYFPVMVKWVGFNVAYVNVKHMERNGETSYNLKKRIHLALDVILSYSNKPIRLLVKLGIFISFSSFLVSLYYFIYWLNYNVISMGYTSVIISIWFLSGVIISTLGVIGLYVGKIFEDVKNRPLYIIKKIVND